MRLLESIRKPFSQIFSLNHLFYYFIFNRVFFDSFRILWLAKTPSVLETSLLAPFYLKDFLILESSLVLIFNILAALATEIFFYIYK